MFAPILTSLTAAIITAAVNAAPTTLPDRYYRVMVVSNFGGNGGSNWIRQNGASGQYWSYPENSTPPSFDFRFKGVDEGNPNRWIFSADGNKCLTYDAARSRAEGWFWAPLSRGCTNWVVEEDDAGRLVLGLETSRQYDWILDYAQAPRGAMAVQPCPGGGCFGEKVRLQLSRRPDN